MFMMDSVAEPLPHTGPMKFDSLEELYNLYGRPAFGLAMRVLGDSAKAEDAVQEVFLRYYSHPAIFTAKSGPFLNWLLREVRCECLGRLKSNFELPLNSPVAPELNFNTIIIKTAPAATGPEFSPFSLQQEQARQALAALPQEQRNLVELAYFKGLSHREIAEITGQPLQAVRKVLTKGLLQLKAKLAS